MVGLSLRIESAHSVANTLSSSYSPRFVRLAVLLPSRKITLYQIHNQILGHAIPLFSAGIISGVVLTAPRLVGIHERSTLGVEQRGNQASTTCRIGERTIEQLRESVALNVSRSKQYHLPL